VILAHASRFEPGFLTRASRYRGLLVPVGLLLVAPCSSFHKETFFVQTAGFTLLYLGYGCLLVAAASTSGTAPAPGRPSLLAPGPGPQRGRLLQLSDLRLVADQASGMCARLGVYRAAASARLGCGSTRR